jgi:hypothetical protein
VFLEALLSGRPCVSGNLDASPEAFKRSLGAALKKVCVE